MEHKQVVSEIVDHDLCIGCGICVGVCPPNILEMGWLKSGDLAPSIYGDCPPTCNVCLRVCPFGEESSSEDRLAHARFGNATEVSHDREVGYHLKTFVGYSLVGGHRQNGASGGMMTWLLENLLVRTGVDAVISVRQSTTDGELFHYEVSDDIDTVRSMSGSNYHPIEMAEVIALMNSRDIEKSYAVVGLPCFLKGLSLAMETMPRLKRRVIYTLGLACGHLPNRFYTEFLAQESGVNSEKLYSVEYRRKKNTNRAGNFNFRAMTDDVQGGSEIPFSDISNVWSAGYFGFNACNYCDDIFAEVADVVVMDAWLPKYERDTRGHSMLVVRNPKLLSLLYEGIKSQTCHLESIPMSQISDSQRGVIYHKRYMLGARVFWAKLHGWRTPPKRIEPDLDAYRKNRWQVKARFAVQKASKVYWPSVRSQNIRLFKLRLYLLSLPIVWHRLSSRVQRLIKTPSLLLRFFGN